MYKSAVLRSSIISIMLYQILICVPAAYYLDAFVSVTQTDSVAERLRFLYIAMTQGVL